MIKQRIQALLLGLFILWIFFVLASFFAVQKPFTTANALAFANLLLDLLTAAWLALVGLGLGAWLLRRLWPAEPGLLEELVFGLGLGLGGLALLGLGLGLAGLFQPLTAYVVMGILSLLAAPPLWRLLRRAQWPPAERPHPLAAIYLMAMALFALAAALLPPTDWDGLFYHLTGPKLYLESGRIVGGMDVPHFSFPSLMEMLFSWAMLLRGDIAAKLLHLLFGLLLTGLVYLTARRFLGRRSAWPAVLILTSMPMLVTLAGWAYNDLALAFYQLASLYAIINDQFIINNEDDDRQVGLKLPQTNKLFWLILCGVFAGLAMGLKYTSFVTPLVIGGLLLWPALSRPTPSRFTFYALRFVLFSLTTLLIACPWYLKNWIFTGNPVYPFLYDLFGGQAWDGFRADWYGAGGTGIGWRPGTLLTLPWLLTLGFRDANYWDGRTGPLLLLFLPVVIGLAVGYRGPERPRALNALLVYSLAHFAFWALGVIWSQALWQSRLLLPGLVGLAPAAGWAWAKLAGFDLPKFSISGFANIVVGLTLALTVIDQGLLTLNLNPAPYLVGQESRDDYLARRLGAHYAAMRQLNELLPPEAKVIFLWEPRSYYCRPTCLPDSILDRFPHLVWQYGSAEAIAGDWREAGISHVLIHRTGLNFIASDLPGTIDKSILAQLESVYLDPLLDLGGAYQLYSLKTEPYKP
jgi:4-amino-4-deoxy-L-arabinose transferase-like glycosyltransferase